MEQKWPQQIWLVRHGQSAGNVAREVAHAASHHEIDLATRDIDTPLSDLGVQQSEALARWFAALPDSERPTVMLHSPYVRAADTAHILLRGLGGLDVVQADERLREKEFGIIDRLTPLGIRHRYPDLHEQREHVGKFYFRPPGGESWCDVILRLRSLLDTIVREHRGERVLVVAHQVIVNCFRYLLERMTEAEILEFDRAGDVPNCSVTSYRFNPALGERGKLELELMNFIAPLEDTGIPVTVQKDMPAAPKP